MASKYAEIVKSFRKTFSLPSKELVQYFPGHMQSGMVAMNKNLKTVDCVIEIHDARIPFSGRNPRFKDIISLKPHILILNKMDLTDMKHADRVVNKLKEDGVDKVFFMTSKVSQNKIIRKRLIPAILEAINSRPRYHRAEVEEYNAMIMGVPNVGKSTFINSVRSVHTDLKRKGARVGAVAGITRNVSKLRVSFDPDLFLLDTPGILTPSVPDLESGMRLALCACLQDHLVGQDYIVSYLLYLLNMKEKFSYVDYFGLDVPTDDVYEFLFHIAKKNQFFQKRKSAESGGYVHRPDFTRAANTVIKAFREGELGKFMLDDDKL